MSAARKPCPACGEACAADVLMCRTCWFSAPQGLRREVNAAWRACGIARKAADSAAWGVAIRRYLAAHDEAIRLAKEARGG